MGITLKVEMPNGQEGQQLEITETLADALKGAGVDAQLATEPPKPGEKGMISAAIEFALSYLAGKAVDKISSIIAAELQANPGMTLTVSKDGEDASGNPINISLSAATKNIDELKEILTNLLTRSGEVA